MLINVLCSSTHTHTHTVQVHTVKLFGVKQRPPDKS